MLILKSPEITIQKSFLGKINKSKKSKKESSTVSIHTLSFMGKLIGKIYTKIIMFKISQVCK